MTDMQPGREYVAAFRGTAGDPISLNVPGGVMSDWLQHAAAVVPVADGPQLGDRVEWEGREWIVCWLTIPNGENAFLASTEEGSYDMVQRSTTADLRILARAVFVPEPQPDPLPAWLRDIGEATHAIVLLDESTVLYWQRANGQEWCNTYGSTIPRGEVEAYAIAGRLRIVSRNGEPYTGEA